MGTCCGVEGATTNRRPAAGWHRSRGGVQLEEIVRRQAQLAAGGGTQGAEPTFQSVASAETPPPRRPRGDLSASRRSHRRSAGESGVDRSTTQPMSHQRRVLPSLTLLTNAPSSSDGREPRSPTLISPKTPLAENLNPSPARMPSKSAVAAPSARPPNPSPPTATQSIAQGTGFHLQDSESLDEIRTAMGPDWPKVFDLGQLLSSDDLTTYLKPQTDSPRSLRSGGGGSGTPGCRGSAQTSPSLEAEDDPARPPYRAMTANPFEEGHFTMT